MATGKNPKKSAAARQPRRAAKRGAVYYAHAMCTYGHPLEADQLDAIQRGLPGHRVINPADFDDHPEKQRDTLGFCLRLIEAEAEGVVFTRLFGKITAGVGGEINHALKLGRDVFELVCNEEAEEWEFLRHHTPVKHVSRAETMRLYRRFREGGQ